MNSQAAFILQKQREIWTVQIRKQAKQQVLWKNRKKHIQSQQPVLNHQNDEQMQTVIQELISQFIQTKASNQPLAQISDILDKSVSEDFKLELDYEQIPIVDHLLEILECENNVQDIQNSLGLLLNITANDNLVSNKILTEEHIDRLLKLNLQEESTYMDILANLLKDECISYLMMNAYFFRIFDIKPIMSYQYSCHSCYLVSLATKYTMISTVDLKFLFQMFIYINDQIQNDCYKDIQFQAYQNLSRFCKKISKKHFIDILDEYGLNAFIINVDQCYQQDQSKLNIYLEIMKQLTQLDIRINNQIVEFNILQQIVRQEQMIGQEQITNLSLSILTNLLSFKDSQTVQIGQQIINSEVVDKLMNQQLGQENILLLLGLIEEMNHNAMKAQLFTQIYINEHQIINYLVEQLDSECQQIIFATLKVINQICKMGIQYNKAETIDCMESLGLYVKVEKLKTNRQDEDVLELLNEIDLDQYIID